MIERRATRPGRARPAPPARRPRDSRSRVGGGLVEDHHPGLGQQQPGDGEPLALAAGAGSPARPPRCRAPRAATPRAPSSRALRSAAQRVVVGGVGPGEAQVGADGLVEQVAVLGDDADGARGWRRSSGPARRPRRGGRRRRRRRRAGARSDTSVDLPAPDGPTIATICPGAISSRRRRGAPRRRPGRRARRPPRATPATPVSAAG